jgi:hypothetical protein
MGNKEIQLLNQCDKKWHIIIQYQLQKRPDPDIFFHYLHVNIIFCPAFVLLFKIRFT